MSTMVTKVAGAVAVALGLLTVGPASAGFDEAQTWSFMQPKPAAPATVDQGTARAYYQDDASTAPGRKRHKDLDCFAQKGSSFTCRPVK